MNSIEKLANMFRERDNPNRTPITQGVVESATPLKIRWGERVVLEESNLVIAQMLKGGFKVGNQTISNPLKKGDRVIMIPTDDYTNFYVIDKVG